eukprot:SAG31_NODE_54_length_29987_cov_4.570664_22_plen_88_part_00
MGKGALPHPAFWQELFALAKDGVTFAAAKAKELQRGTGGPPARSSEGDEVLLNGGDGDRSQKENCSPTGNSGAKKEPSDSDSDSLVE